MSSRDPIRIGVIVPAGNVVHQREFEQLRDDEAEFRFADFAYPAATTADFRGELMGRLASPFGALRDWGARAILLGCTTASMSCYGEDFQTELEALAGAPVVTAAGAVVAAAEALGARRLAVATPYGDGANAMVANFLRGQDLEVTSIDGLGLDGSAEDWATVPERSTGEIVRLALAGQASEADAIYLPCTALPSLAAILECEATTGKPAYSSVQAGFRSVMLAAGISPERNGAGGLLAPRHGATLV